MNSTYIDKYTIVQTFKETESQKVFIGTDNRNGDAVVINNIYIGANDPIWGSIEETYAHIFKHVLHFERLEDRVVFVTKVKEGLSLNGYLNDFSPSFTERVNLIHQYLDGIKPYDVLPNNIRSILVDESQIIISEGKISFDELIIFDEGSLKVNTFRSVLDNIVLVLKKLTSLKSINYEEMPIYIKVMGFLDDLQKNSSSYTSVSDISIGLAKLNILSSLIPNESILNGNQNLGVDNSSNLVGRKVGSINEDTIKMADLNKSRIFTMAIGTAGVATVALAGFFAFKSIFPLDKGMSLDENHASSGILSTYDLDNKDSNKNEKNSILNDPLIENNTEAIGPNSNINYVSEYIEEDFTTAKYGDFSFKISGNEGASHKISISQGPILSNSQLLMWVKADTDATFTINIDGYSSDVLVFKESISHKPLAINNWELLQLTFNKDVTDYVDISFNGIDGTVWVDKISISILK